MCRVRIFFKKHIFIYIYIRGYRARYSGVRQRVRACIDFQNGIYIHIYILIYILIWIHIFNAYSYVWIERERGRESTRERERDRERERKRRAKPFEYGKFKY